MRKAWLTALLLAPLLAPSTAFALCPDGARPDSGLGFCVQGQDAYGPFPKAMTDACVAAGAGSSCTATVMVQADGVSYAVQRWSKSFAQSLRGSASCPRGTSPSSAHDGLCLESLASGTKNLYAMWSAPLAAKCRWQGHGNACLSHRWLAGVYLAVRDAQPRVRWSEPASLNSALPYGLQLFRGSGTLANGTAIQATLARWVPTLAPELTWDVERAGSTGLRTPTQFSQGTGPRRWVIINGGYFGGSPASSSSLLVSNGSLLARGATMLSRGGLGYHPTRAAFGEDASGLQAVWAYPASQGTLWQYPQVSPNAVGQSPQPEPSASFPSGGSAWTPRVAVGGGPMLLRGGLALNTAAAELFDAASGVAPASAAPRSAIARSGSGALYLLVVDGRSEFSGGINLADLSTLLLSVGARDAINLDGGGSSSLVANGALLSSPSDPGGERAVHSVVVIRAKN